MQMKTMAEQLSAYQCRFPTTASGQDKNAHFKTDEITEEFAHEALSEDTVSTSWAILLRAYLGSDIVGFLRVDHDFMGDVTNGRKNIASLQHDTTIKYELSRDAIPSTLQPQHIKDETRSITVNSQINTAICYMTDEIKLDQGPRHRFEALRPNIDFYIEVISKLQSVQVSLQYKRYQVSAEYASAIVSDFFHICTAVQEANLSVGEIEIVSQRTKSILKSWNPQKLFCQNSCMHHLVEAVAKVHPDKEAVTAWDGTMSYDELDALSSQVAAKLNGAGVGCGDFVPFAFEKSMWAVVATLAILKAGAAFVPLEPTHPSSRIQEILGMIEPKIVLTSKLWRARFAELHEKVFVISSETTTSSCPDSIVDNFPIVTSPDDPMLVLFTSGSTGKPKGMVLSHRAICTHAMAHGGVMGYQDARVLQFAAHTFDVAVMDIFTTLIYSGCICIPSEEQRHVDIAGAVNSLRANYTILTPSYAGLLDPKTVPTLQTVAIGGESLPQETVDRWASEVSLFQIYGPAEVGICLLTKMEPAKLKSHTVGKPLHNCSCWLVDPDDHNQLVPIGAIGELLVASPSLAIGYLKNELQTKQLFIDTPSWALALGLKEARFYRTGDLLRYNVEAFDGSFDFIGRRDYQIKLRGQRLEPSEIEQEIAKIGIVANSVVLKPSAGCLAGSLVAVVQLRTQDSTQIRSESIKILPDQTEIVQEIESTLTKMLPQIMIPSHTIIINDMPRVPSLKIDRPAVRRWLETLDALPDSSFLSNDSPSLHWPVLRADESTALKISNFIARMVTRSPEQRIMLAQQDISIQDVGLDSINLISLAMFLRNEFGVKVSMLTLGRPNATVRSVVDDLFGQGFESLDEVARGLFRERITWYMKELGRGLDRALSVPRPIPVPVERHVLLTGGTGYLGSAVLKTLLSSSQINVYVVVRGGTKEEAMRRIITTAKVGGWWSESFLPKLHAWPGDLAKKNLGLTSSDLEMFLGRAGEKRPKIDCVIHNGARVHYSATFDSLAPDNIDGTMHLLEMASQSPYILDFLYVTGGMKPCLTSPESEIDLAMESGYAQTKGVAEMLVAQASSHPSFRLKQTTILKPGYIIGSLYDGKASCSDFIWRLIAGCLEIGAYNIDEADHWLFITDVNSIAERIKELAMPEMSGSVYRGNSRLHGDQVLSGVRFSTIWRILQDDFGYVLVGLDQHKWLKDLTYSVRKGAEAHLLFPLLHVLEKDGQRLGTPVVPMGYEIDAEIIRCNIDYLLSIGFLPHPTNI